jgi:hypothetical protein
MWMWGGLATWVPDKGFIWELILGDGKEIFKGMEGVKIVDTVDASCFYDELDYVWAPSFHWPFQGVSGTLWS